MEPTLVTWILVIFGILIDLPLGYGQLLLIRDPHGQKTKDLVIGKGEDWRDKTHLKFAYGAAWADWLLVFPILIAGSIGVLLGTYWGYMLWISAGSISLYINFILWFLEREYVYPAWGPLVYYTFYWGFYVYWGLAVLIYGLLRITGIH